LSLSIVEISGGLFFEHLHRTAITRANLSGLTQKAGLYLPLPISHHNVVARRKIEDAQILECFIKTSIGPYLLYKPTYIEFTPDHYFRQLDGASQPGLFDSLFRAGLRP
jgi:hypothetical protein